MSTVLLLAMLPAIACVAPQAEQPRRTNPALPPVTIPADNPQTRPKVALGRQAVTHDPADRGRFKTPGLRNVALTWPYLHDGSAAMLGDVIEFYDRGGVPNPTLDIRIKPLGLTDEEQRDLVAFLQTLTGTLPKIGRPTLPK